MTWRGKISSLSHLAELGLISRSANWRSVSRIVRCSSLRSKFIETISPGLAASRASFARSYVFAHPLDDILGRSAGSEDFLDARLAQLARVVLGDDTAAEDRDIAGAALLQQAHHLRKERQVSARE